MKKYFFAFIGKLLCIVYPYKLHQHIIAYLNIIYSEYVSEQFGRKGEDVLIGRHSKIHCGNYFYVGDGTTFGHHAMLSAWKTGAKVPLVKIGKYCDFGHFNHITCCQSIEIGEGVLTGMYVLISDNSHGRNDLTDAYSRPVVRPLFSKGPVKIGRNVWIGDKVTILGGVSIGEGAIIGANSVVTHDIPAYSIAAGIPARVIKNLEHE